MQVYDLDKTQEWLNRTLAISKEPPVRGGLRPDHKARRQTALAIGIVALVLLVLALLPLRRAVVPVAAPLQEPLALAEPPAQFAAPVPVQPRDDLTTKWLSSLQRHEDNRPILDVMPQPFARSRNIAVPPDQRVPPAAPIWLDGQK